MQAFQVKAPHDFSLVDIEMPQAKAGEVLVGSRLNNCKFPEVIEMLASGRLDATALVSHRLPFAEMSEAIHMIDHHPESARKVLIDLSA